MTLLKMDSMQDTPSAEALLEDPASIWAKTDSDRKKLLTTICSRVFDKYVTFQYHSYDQDSKDRVLCYSNQLLSVGLFYLEYSDAIKEGDGNRILRCWRYLLPMFLGSKRTKYSTEAFTLLFQHDFLFSPRLAKSLIWNRFVNAQGVSGANISMDLHMEHLNRVAKGCIKSLQAGRNPNTIQRIGKAIGTVAPVISNFESANSIKLPSGKHKRVNCDKDTSLTVNELLLNKVFIEEEGRKHNSFPNPKNILHRKEPQEVNTWIKEKIKTIV